MTSIESKKKAKPKMVVAFLSDDGRVIRCQSMVIPDHKHLEYDESPELHAEVSESDLD